MNPYIFGVAIYGFEFSIFLMHTSFNEKAKSQASRRNDARMDAKLSVQEKF